MPALDDAAFAACMARLEPFENAPFLAVAVSGGADSLALTLLADRWARERGGRITGLTVDHGLRPGSAEEARKTGDWLAARQIEHHILTWHGDKPETGLQRRAREARYGLLQDWCWRHHAFHLLTAHHRDDQAETVALRKARLSGDRGLAAMPVIREMAGLRLLRPLLGVDRSTLEAWLRAEGQPWIDDPSNDNPAFTRNRLRQAGLDVQALSREAEEHGTRRSETDRLAARSLIQHVIVDPAGFALLDGKGFGSLPIDLACDLLTRLLVTIGGNIYPPRGRALARLLRHMQRHLPGDSAAKGPQTLAHCRILPHRESWLICREKASSDPLPLVPGEWQCWDGRFLVSLRSEREDLTIEALGSRTRLAKKALKRWESARHLPGVVRSTLPSIFKGEWPIAVPHLGLFEATFAPESIDLRFSPRTPLANAPFMPHISG